jgi:hypothetical protein
MKCLRKDPGQRYADAHELAEHLRRFLEGRATAARPGRFADGGGKVRRWAGPAAAGW